MNCTDCRGRTGMHDGEAMEKIVERVGVVVGANSLHKGC